MNVSVKRNAVRYENRISNGNIKPWTPLFRLRLDASDTRRIRSRHAADARDPANSTRHDGSRTRRAWENSTTPYQRIQLWAQHWIWFERIAFKRTQKRVLNWNAWGQKGMEIYYTYTCMEMWQCLGIFK